MKRFSMIIALVLSTSIFLSSCGGGSAVDSDAKRVAELSCKAQELLTKVAAGDADAAQESAKIAKEAADLQKEFEDKYTSESDQRAFGEALAKAIAACQ